MGIQFVGIACLCGQPALARQGKADAIGQPVPRAVVSFLSGEKSFEIDHGATALKVDDVVVFVRRTGAGPTMLGSGRVQRVYRADCQGIVTDRWPGGKGDISPGDEVYIICRSDAAFSLAKACF